MDVESGTDRHLDIPFNSGSRSSYLVNYCVFVIRCLATHTEQQN